MALDLDPAHLPTLGALRQIAIDSADWDRAARYLDQEQLNTAGAARSARKLLVELGKLRDEMLGEHDAARPGLRARARSATPTTRTPRCRSSTSTSTTSSGRRPSRSPTCSSRRRQARARASSTRCTTCSARSHAALGKDEQGAQGLPGGAPARPHRPGDDPRPRRRVLPAQGLGRARSPTTRRCSPASARTTSRRAPNVYYKLGCIKQEQGQAKQAINNFEKALARRAARTARRSKRWSTSTTSLKDWKQVCALQAADPRQRLRGRRALQDARRDRRHLGREGEEPRTRRIEALEEALDLEPQNHVLLHKLLQLYQAHVQLAEDDRLAPAHRRARDATRAQVASTSTRWRSSTATS